ncbi:MAG: TatD family hydrolase [Clostridiales bacterium]|nr:TatD family hydrolase [Clostridiales bacterium]
MIIDSHCHLDDKRFDEDRDQVIEKIQQANIDLVINIGANLSSSKASVELAKQYDFIYAAVGVHPHDSSSYTEKVEKEITSLAAHKKVVAIGEVGLDFHYDFSPRDIQLQVFIKQIKLANQLDMPLIIHDREAHQPVLEALRKYKDEKTIGVFHSYSGSSEMIRDVLELGFYLSFNGISTFKNAKKVHDAIFHTPLDKLLIETDSPYLTPEPFRGKRNDSSNVIYVAKAIAKIKGITIEEVYEKTTENTKKLFKLSK